VTGPSTVVSPTSIIATGTGAKTVVVGASVEGASVSVTGAVESTVDESLVESLLEQPTAATTNIGITKSARIFMMIPRSINSDIDNRPTSLNVLVVPCKDSLFGHVIPNRFLL
jgi:hypothetical protein